MFSLSLTKWHLNFSFCDNLIWSLVFPQRQAAGPWWTQRVIYLLTVLSCPWAHFWCDGLHGKHWHLVSRLRAGWAAAWTAHIPRGQWGGPASRDYQSECPDQVCVSCLLLNWSQWHFYFLFCSAGYLSSMHLALCSWVCSVITLYWCIGVIKDCLNQPSQSHAHMARVSTGWRLNSHYVCFQVLGTPTREQIREMNPNYTEFKFPQIKAHPWTKVRWRDVPENLWLSQITSSCPWILNPHSCVVWLKPSLISYKTLITAGCESVF